MRNSRDALRAVQRTRLFLSSAISRHLARGYKPQMRQSVKRATSTPAAAHTHDAKWMFALGNGSKFCIGCAIIALDRSGVSNDTKRVILPKLLYCIQKHKQELSAAFELHANVASGVLKVLLDTGLQSENRLLDLAFQGIIQILHLVKADEHAKMVLETLCSQIDREPNPDRVLPALRLIHQLVQGFPHIIKAVHNSLYSIVHLCCRCIQNLKGPLQHDAIQCLTTLVAPDTARLFRETTWRQVVQQTLTLLCQHDSDTILKEALGLLRELALNRNAIDMLFTLPLDSGNSFPIILKRLLLSAKPTVYTTVIECMTKILKIDETELYGEQMLEVDICEVLFEMLNSCDAKQCSLVCECLSSFTEYKSLYKRLHILYGMETIFQRCQDFLHQQQDTSSLFAFVSILLRGFKPDFGVPLFDNTKKIASLLELLAQAIAVKSGKELLHLYMCFRDIFQHVRAAIPWEEMTKCLSIAGERVMLLQAAIRQQAGPKQMLSQESALTGSSRNHMSNFNALLVVYGGIMKNTLRLLLEHPAGSLDAASPSKSLQGGMMQVSLQSFDECFLPQTMKLWREKPSDELIQILYECLAMVLKLEHPGIMLLTKKLVSSGFLSHTLYVKHVTRSSCSGAISSGLCELLKRLARLHEEDIDYLHEPLLDGLEHISGSPLSLLAHLYSGSSESSKGASLLILYFVYLEEELTLQPEVVLNALCEGIHNLDMDWGINIKAVVLLSAISWVNADSQTKARISEELKSFWHSLYEYGPSGWITLHPALLEWSVEAVGQSQTLDDTYQMLCSDILSGTVSSLVFSHWSDALIKSLHLEHVSKEQSNYKHFLHYFAKNVESLKIFLHLFNDEKFRTHENATLLETLLCDIKEMASDQASLYDHLENILSRSLLRFLNSSKQVARDNVTYLIIVLWKNLTDLLQDRTPAQEMDLTLINLSHYAISYLRENVSLQLGLTCGNFITVLVSHSLQNSCQVVGLLFLRNKDALDFLAKWLKDDDMPQRVLGYSLTACLLEFTRFFLHTEATQQPEYIINVDGEHAMELIRADSFPEVLSGLIFWSSYFSSSSSSNGLMVHLKKQLNGSNEHGRITDLLLGDKEVRTMVIHMQQHLAKNHNLLQRQSSICLRNLVSYLRIKAPALAARVLEQSWNYPIYQMCLKAPGSFKSTLPYTIMLLAHYLKCGTHPGAVDEWIRAAGVAISGNPADQIILAKACQQLTTYDITDDRLTTLFSKTRISSGANLGEASPYVNAGGVVVYLTET